MPHVRVRHPSGQLSVVQIRSRRIGHCCIIDWVFEPVEEADNGPQAVRFRAAAELTPEALTTITDICGFFLALSFASLLLVQLT